MKKKIFKENHNRTEVKKKRTICYEILVIRDCDNGSNLKIKSEVNENVS